jgi:hypothetical protein
MFLLEATDGNCPRMYLAFFRKVISMLTSLATRFESVKEELKLYLSDMLNILAARTAVSGDVKSLVDLIYDDEQE